MKRKFPLLFCILLIAVFLAAIPHSVSAAEQTTSRYTYEVSDGEAIPGCTLYLTA